jgi:PadR family transcriptional regulator, regulatory protein AphA
LLTPTAIIVLGLIELAGEATPYDLKQAVAGSVGNFWSVPHSQLYAEPERLAGAGLLSERREERGRRRRLFSLTEQGRAALAAWRAEPSEDPLPELRDPGLLRLFFGAEPAALAAARAEAHRAKLEEYERQAACDPGDGPRGPWLALRAGVRHEREWVRFWEELVDEG